MTVPLASCTFVPASGVEALSRPRPCRLTRRRSGLDDGDRRSSGRLRGGASPQAAAAAGRPAVTAAAAVAGGDPQGDSPPQGSGSSDRRRSERRRGVRRCGKSSGAGVAVGKATARHGNCRVKAARDVLHIEAELLDLVDPAREEAFDVSLRAKP